MQSVILVLLVSTALVLLGSLDFQDAEAPVICHNGATMEFPDEAVAPHLAHGDAEGACTDEIVSTSQDSKGLGASNFNHLPELVVGGEFIGIDTTAVLVAGSHSLVAWMIPVIVSAMGIGIVIARKF